MLERLCTHPNVGAALLVSLGCEGFNRERLADSIRATGRPVEVVVIQQLGGTRATVAAGREWLAATRKQLDETPRVPDGRERARRRHDLRWLGRHERHHGQPAVGRFFDNLVAAGATAIFEETGELIGCETHMAARAVTPELGAEIEARVHKAAEYYTHMGHGSFAPGNAEGGLTTIEEKSLGAYSKSGPDPSTG
jgi:altronate hydrolase